MFELMGYKPWYWLIVISKLKYVPNNVLNTNVVMKSKVTKQIKWKHGYLLGSRKKMNYWNLCRAPKVWEEL